MVLAPIITCDNRRAFLDVPAMQQPEAYLGGADKFFDADGKLTNTNTQGFLKKFMDLFADLDREATRSHSLFPGRLLQPDRAIWHVTRVGQVELDAAAENGGGNSALSLCQACRWFAPSAAAPAHVLVPACRAGGAPIADVVTASGFLAHGIRRRRRNDHRSGKINFGHRLPPAATRRRERYRVIEGVISGVPDAVIALDRANNVLAWNAAAQKIAPALAAGTPLSLSLRSPDLIAAMRRVVASNEAERIEFREHVPIDAWWDVHILPVTIDSPPQTRLAFIILTLQDLAPLRRGEMRTNFVANVSHELRTPLASVLGFVETCRDRRGRTPRRASDFSAS